MSYELLKTIHLVSLILWIGPAIGAYFMADYGKQNAGATYKDWPEKALEKVLRLEHISFLILLLSGLLLLSHHGLELWNAPWFKNKVILLVFIVLFEIYDSWLHHYYIRKFADTAGYDSKIGFHKKVLTIASVPVILGIIWVIRLAVYK